CRRRDTFRKNIGNSECKNRPGRLQGQALPEIRPAIVLAFSFLSMIVAGFAIGTVLALQGSLPRPGRKIRKRPPPRGGLRSLRQSFPGAQRGRQMVTSEPG